MGTKLNRIRWASRNVVKTRQPIEILDLMV